MTALRIGHFIPIGPPGDARSNFLLVSVDQATAVTRETAQEHVKELDRLYSAIVDNSRSLSQEHDTPLGTV